MLLADKSVVITGAGSGVGRASSLRFAAEGARVVCADVRDDWAAETARLVTEAGGTAIRSGATSPSKTMSSPRSPPQSRRSVVST